MQTNSNNSNEAINNMISKVQDDFSEREAYFIEMQSIDEDAIKLNLPENYKEFFNKRLAADKNDFYRFYGLP